MKVIVSLASSLYNQHDSATSGSPTKLLSHRKFSTPIKMHRIQLPGQERKYILFNRNAKNALLRYAFRCLLCILLGVVCHKVHKAGPARTSNNIRVKSP